MQRNLHLQESTVVNPRFRRDRLVEQHTEGPSLGEEMMLRDVLKTRDLFSTW
jgi:hypothetical protein